MAARQRKQISEPAKLAPITAATEYRENALLLPYQQRWVLDTSGYKVCEKSRRIGITWATAVACVLRAAQGVSDVWYVCYKEDATKEFIRDCEKWAESLNLFASEMGEVVIQFDDEGKTQDVRAFQITFPSGFRVTGLTSSPRSLRGKQGLVVIDEAAFHDDLGGLLKAATAFRMWGGEVWVMSTHLGVDNAFNKLCEDIRDGKKPGSLHCTTLADALRDGLHKRIWATLPKKQTNGEPWSAEREAEWKKALYEEYGDDAQEELDVIPAKSGQTYISRTLVEGVMFEAPVLRFVQKDEWLTLGEEERTRETNEWLEAVVLPLFEQWPEDARAGAFGWDFGRYSDLSVLAPGYVAQNLKRVVPFVTELKNVPFNQQWQVLKYIVEHIPHFMFGCMDAGGNGSWVAEQAWLEFGGDDYIERVQLSQMYYRDHMPAFKTAHEDKLIAYPRDIDIRNDVSQIRRVNGIPKIPDLKVEAVGHAGKRHGDAAIALFLFNNAASKAGEMWARWENLSAL